jgi:thiol-disulfide isomerase/thioredoxin
MFDWFRSVALGSVLVGGLVAAVLYLPGARPGAAAPTGVAEDTLGALPADEWLNVDGAAPTAESLKGSVVLVEFWTYLCYNCKNVESWMQHTHRRWGDRGLAVLGIHTPEFDVERNVENVRRYLRDNGIAWPVAIDNEFRVWRRYNTTNAWPAFLVFDRDGRLVYRRAGEGAVHGAAEAIEHSLGRPRTSSQAEASRPGVQVTSTVTRPSADTAMLTVTLTPEARTRLVRRPANELRILMPPGVGGPEGPVLIGEAGTPADAGELVYFDAPASVTVPLTVRGSGPFRIEGRVIYRSCDRDAGTCRRDETTFAATVPRRL